MPKTKNGTRNCQNGGAKTSTLTVFSQNNQDWVSTDNDREISRLILRNSDLWKVVSSGSLCSMIIKCRINPHGNVKIRSQIYDQDGALLSAEHRADRPRFVDVGKEHAHVCMKISLATRPTTPRSTVTADAAALLRGVTAPPAAEASASASASTAAAVTRVEWDETPTIKIRKVVTTVEEANEELENQMLIYQELLCGQNASDIIPDGIAACVLTPEDFSIYVNAIKLKSPEGIDAETLRVITWIINSATTHRLNIHIEFMEFLEGFDTLANFFRRNPAEDIQRIISYKMAVVILTLLLKTFSASWDFHSGNGLTNGAEGRAVDFGRIYRFYDQRTKALIVYYLESLWQDHTEHYEGLTHFFNIADISEFESLLTVFNKHYNRLLIQFPKNKYVYPQHTPSMKRRYIYESLIIIAFIDGITKKIKFNTDGFQCSSIMRRVFHVETVFNSLDEFLRYFTLDYDVFIDERRKADPAYISELNIGLDTISTGLEPMLHPCRLTKRTTGADFRPKSDSVEPTHDTGGKKRRHTQKKYKIRRYSYSRNKHRRGSRRVRKT